MVTLFSISASLEVRVHAPLNLHWVFYLPKFFLVVPVGLLLRPLPALCACQTTEETNASDVQDPVAVVGEARGNRRPASRLALALTLADSRYGWGRDPCRISTSRRGVIVADIEGGRECGLIVGCLAW